MGGNFGNKNQNQDADLIAAMLAKDAGAPVKLELSRKEDFIGMHGRWPTVQYYKVGTTADGTLQAIALRAYSGMGPYRKNSGTSAASISTGARTSNSHQQDGVGQPARAGFPQGFTKWNR
jgi:CO/xanthine dehydrogenase Mo-binding subunit